MAVRAIGCKNGKCVIMLQDIGAVGEVNGRIEEK
jgi:hypothetical protein